MCKPGGRVVHTPVGHRATLFCTIATALKHGDAGRQSAGTTWPPPSNYRFVPFEDRFAWRNTPRISCIYAKVLHLISDTWRARIQLFLSPGRFKPATCGQVRFGQHTPNSFSPPVPFSLVLRVLAAKNCSHGRSLSGRAKPAHRWLVLGAR